MPLVHPYAGKLDKNSFVEGALSEVEESPDWRNAHHIYFTISSREDAEDDFCKVYGHLLMDAVESATYKSAAIAVLPSELLVKIFSCLTIHDPPRIRETWDASGSQIVKEPYLGWIIATHTCHHWRRAAICAASLWTDLEHGLLLGPSWTEEFMLRVRWANVSIPSFENYPRVIEMLSDWILENLDHIRDMTISADWAHYRLPGWLIGDACPELVSVDIDAGPYFDRILSRLFYGCSPKLRRLRLHNIKVWSSPQDWRNLVEVDMQHHSLAWRHGKRPGSIVPTPDWMLPTLIEALDTLDETAPTLERLGLHYMLPSFDPELSSTPRKVHLARLKSMVLSAEMMNIVQLLQHVEFPLGAQLDLTCMPDDSTGLCPIFCLLADRLSRPEGHLTRIELGTGRYEDKLLISAYADHLTDYVHRDSSSLSRRAVEPILKFSLAYALPNDYIDAFITFFKTIPLHDVYQLTIYGSWHVDAEGWHNIMRDSFIYLQSVRLLVLGQDAAQYFFHAIHDMTPSATPDARPVAFPHLDALILRNLDTSLFANSAMDRTPFEDQMLLVLQDRKDRGFPLPALVFISCQGISEAWILRLRELAVARAVLFGF